MKKKKNYTKKCHYVPKVLTKPWQEKPSYIWFRDKKTQQIEKRKFISKKQFYKHKLYTPLVEKDLDYYEKEYGKVENKFEPIKEKLIHNKKLSEEEKNIWIKFIILQIFRTPNRIDNTKKIIKDNLETQTNSDEYLSLSIEIGNDAELISYIKNLEWRIVENEKYEFIISDDPVVIYGEFKDLEFGLAMPLSPKYSFIASKEIDPMFKGSIDFTIELNKSQMENASLLVVGNCEENYIKKYLKKR